MSDAPKPSFKFEPISALMGLMAGAVLTAVLMSNPAPAESAADQGLADVAVSNGASSSDGADNRPEAKGVTIKMLQEAYDANEAKAQRDYGDQMLAITGVVESVTLDLTDDPTVTLADDGRSINASFDKEKGGEATAELRKGQRATLACNQVTETLGTPALSDCYVSSEVWDIREVPKMGAASTKVR